LNGIFLNPKKKEMQHTGLQIFEGNLGWHLAVTPLCLYGIHSFLCKIFVLIQPSCKPFVHKIISACLLTAYWIAWSIVFYPTIPFGSITPQLLFCFEEFIPKAIFWCLSTFALYPYHILVITLSDTTLSHVSYITRKTGLIIILIDAFIIKGMIDTPASTVTRITAWSVRFVFLDLMLDVLSLYNVIEASDPEISHKSRSTRIFLFGNAFRAVAIWAWINFWYDASIHQYAIQESLRFPSLLGCVVVALVPFFYEFWIGNVA